MTSGHEIIKYAISCRRTHRTHCQTFARREEPAPSPAQHFLGGVPITLEAMRHVNGQIDDAALFRIVARTDHITRPKIFPAPGDQTIQRNVGRELRAFDFDRTGLDPPGEQEVDLHRLFRIRRIGLRIEQQFISAGYERLCDNVLKEHPPCSIMQSPNAIQSSRIWRLTTRKTSRILRM